MEYAFDIYKLTTKFISDYPEKKYPELISSLASTLCGAFHRSSPTGAFAKGMTN